MNIKYCIIILIYLAYSIVIQVLISKSRYLNPVQRKIHSYLLWLIPFVWGFLVITAIQLFRKDSKRAKEKINHDSGYSDNLINLSGTASFTPTDTINHIS
jgi:hypothetical protein